MPSEELIDVRTKLDAETNRILDAVAHATGRDKSAIVREVMAEWAKGKVHEATIILRLATRKGDGEA